MKAPLTIALIDDEPAIRRLLATALKSGGHKIVEAGDGQSGLVCVAQHQPDLVLLDLGLPDMDGLEVLDRLREWTDVPVILITVRDSPEEKVAALDSGADDYITKPFHTGELMARVRSVAKRVLPSEQDAVIEIGILRIDCLARQVAAGGSAIELTPIEYRILHTLARHHGKIVTKSTLLQAVWGSTTSSGDEHLRVHMAALRKKLRAHACDPPIRTETGVGYRLEDA